jgi:geranylgeranyl transferase type-2 subunit alpha
LQHGRVKVRSTAEQEARKAAEQQAKLDAFLKIRGKILANRDLTGTFDAAGMSMSEMLLSRAPDFGTLWNWRREGFELMFKTIDTAAQQAACDKELEFLTMCLKKNPKSYGVWHQRRWIMEISPTPAWTEELANCTKFLMLDERNFHCWDYRRFVVSKCGGTVATPDSEFEYSMEKIGENFSNYSAWHYRSSLLPVVRPSAGAVNNVDPEAIVEELETVVQAFYIDPSDQSAWIYHRWLLGRTETPPAASSVRVQVGEDDRLLVATLLLTQPAMVTAEGARVSLNGAAVVGAWSIVQGGATSTGAAATPSAAWRFKSAAPVPLNAAEESRVTVEFDEGALLSTGRIGAAAHSAAIIVPAGAAEGRTHVTDPAGLRRALAKYIIPSEELLTGQLDACRELLEELDEGSERKWALLAIVYILNALGDTTGDRAEMFAAIAKLHEIDGSRRGFYDDLRSRYVCEDQIAAAGCALEGEVDWSARKLATISHLQYLGFATRIDLSGNLLRRLDGFGMLTAVHTLHLDDNQVEGIFGTELRGMASLRVLSLKNNRISTLRGLEGVKRVTLDLLTLTGNPVVEDPGFDLLKLAEVVAV